MSYFISAAILGFVLVGFVLLFVWCFFFNPRQVTVQCQCPFSSQRAPRSRLTPGKPCLVGKSWAWPDRRALPVPVSCQHFLSEHSWERRAADNHSWYTSLGNITFQCFLQPKQIQINTAHSAGEQLQAGLREETLPLLPELAGKD